MYQQAIDYLSSYTDYEKMPMPHDPAFYDLRRVEELLGQLGNPHLKARSVHITGTNGKGSVAAMVASALTASGYTTGLYTSPHLHTWRERIQVSGELISEEELAATVAKVKPEVEAVNRRATYGLITTFELLTVLAFVYFESRKVDFQVLEVGMGGRFDATSVITPEVSILTSISYDHTQVLGNTLAKIAAEKAAIIKPGVTAVISPQVGEVTEVIEGACLSNKARLIRVGSDVTWQSLGFDLTGQQLQVRGRLGSYKLSIPLLGQHQLDNAATAVAALEVLSEKGFNVPAGSIIRGLARVYWPGRFQILRRHPLVLVDGAHNPGAARKLRQALEQHFGLVTRHNRQAGSRNSFPYPDFDRAVLVTGISGDKDVAGIVAELYPLFDRVIVTRSLNPRAMAPALLKAEFARHGVEAEIAEGVPTAVSLALAGNRDLICITGSLFVVGEAIEQVNMRVPVSDHGLRGKPTGTS
jgi:dihydrofolate synthase/folylpolyglutamate synthase